MTSHTSAARAVSRLFIAGSCLALFTACLGVDDGDLDADDEGLSGEEVGAPPSDSEEIGTQQQALLGNDCQNADIRVVNNLSYPITVKSIEYYNGSEGQWRTEDLANQTMNSGTMWFWTPNLDGSDGEWIYSFNVIYECHGSHNHNYHINTPDSTCATGRVYLLEVDPL